MASVLYKTFFDRNLPSRFFAILLFALRVTMVACKKSVVHLSIYIRWGAWLCMYEGRGVAVNDIQITLILHSHLECDMVLVYICFG